MTKKNAYNSFKNIEEHKITTSTCNESFNYDNCIVLLFSALSCDKRYEYKSERIVHCSSGNLKICEFFFLVFQQFRIGHDMNFRKHVFSNLRTKANFIRFYM